MAVRTELITVTDLGITPQAIPDAGIVGEHNATLLKFILPDEYVDAGYLYYLDVVNGNGIGAPSPHIAPVVETINSVSVSTVSFSIPESVTTLGVANMVLNVIELDEVDGVTVDLLIRTLPLNLRFQGQKKTNGTIIVELTDLFQGLLNDIETITARNLIYVGADEPTTDWQIWIDTDDNSYGVPGIQQALPENLNLQANTAYYGTLPGLSTFVLPVAGTFDELSDCRIVVDCATGSSCIVEWGTTLFALIERPILRTNSLYDIEFRWSKVSSAWCVTAILKGVVNV